MSAIDPHLEPAAALTGADGRELAMLRHDIRGALTGVTGAVEQLGSVMLPPEVRQQVEQVSAAARSLTGLVEVLLAGGIDTGGAEPRIETAALLAHLRRRYAGEAAARGLGFQVEADPDVPVGLRTSWLALCRIIDNLVGNAIKFSDSGSVRLGMSRGADGSVFFRITDDGPGLPGADVAAPSRRAGEGLGLQIVRTLAKRAGADASIGNRPGGGAEAVVRLPASMADDRHAAPRTPSARDAVSALSGVRILLAEDNPTNQMVASQMLRSLDAEVTVSSDGVEALECFEAGVFDMVVVDIEMPRLSGLDVIRAIRGRPDGRAQVPIVALTAYAMREHRERIAAAGANGLISKPITSVEDLGRGLAAHLGWHPEEAAVGSDAATDESTDPLVDQGVYDALVAAIGVETMGELLEKVIADLLSAQADLAAALPEVERVRIRSASHILISVAGAIGAVRLQHRARDLNALAHTDATAGIEAATRRCIGEIDAAVAFARERRPAR